MKALTVAFFILIIAALAIFASPELASSRARPTPTPCETIAEGVLRCGNELRTAQVGPVAPRRATQTPTKGGR